MNLTQMEDVLRHVTHPQMTFVLTEEATHVNLRGEFEGKCFKTGSVEKWKTRSWRISFHMTKSEIVQTALKCLLTAVEHEAREAFKYKGQAIFGPHYDVDKLAALCATDNHEDVRPSN